LPRIVSTEEDLDFIFDKVPSHANGLTFCVGSFGSRADNDLVNMADKYAERIHFTHLRNVVRKKDGSFYEAEHLDGDLNMIEIVQAILRADTKEGRTSEIFMRPDHGHLLGMAELRGVVQTVQYLGN